MAAADVQTPLLAVSALPSILMTYLTGPSSPAEPEPEQQEQHHLDHPHAHFSNHRSNSLDPKTTISSSRLLVAAAQSKASLNRNSLPIMSSDADEAHTSREGSLMSVNGRSQKRSSRPKTSYSINHAPPKGNSRHRIHVRARPLLQLHLLSAVSRPMPAFELLPSAIFSPSLSRAISKTFKARHGLCPADLAIVKAEKYHQHEESDKEEDESRDILALICKGKKTDGHAGGKAKLLLDDGSEWEAYPLSNGGYEFVSTDDHGLAMTARWVLRRPRARRSQSASDMATFTGDSMHKKFNFSIISPNSRRHPVVASLSSASLDINDSYTIPLPTTFSREISPSGSDYEVTRTSIQEEGQEAPEPVTTTASLKALITATAVWVTLREGWCPGYRSEDSMTRSPSMRLSISPSKPSGEFAAAAGLDKEDLPRRSGSIARILRLKRRSTNSAPVDGPADEVTRSSSLRTSTLAERRLRAESTSTVVIHSKRPRGRRANTASTSGSSIPVNMDLAQEEMTEEEEEEEDEQAGAQKAVAIVAKTKHASTPTPLIRPLDGDSEEEHGGSTAVSTPTRTIASNRKQKRDSALSTNMSIDAKKAEASPKARKPKGGRFRSLFCGMAG